VALEDFDFPVKNFVVIIEDFPVGILDSVWSVVAVFNEVEGNNSEVLICEDVDSTE